MSKPYSTWYAKREIRRHIKKIDNLPAIDTDYVDVEPWAQAIKELSRHIFKHDETFAKGIDEAVSSQNGMIVRSALLAILRDMERRVRTTGVPIDYTAPKAIIWKTLGGTILTGLIILVLGHFLFGNGDTVIVPVDSAYLDSIAQSTMLDSATVMIGDLQSWYRHDNARFKNALDSVLEFSAIQYGFGNGSYFKNVIKFAEAWRLDRDKTIDSFYVRLSAYEVDPATLKVQRRLPVRIGQTLKPGLERLGFDQPMIDRQVLMLDTL